MERLLKTIDREDGVARVQVLCRADGLFIFVEEAWVTHENISTGEEYAYWQPIGGGGLYPRAEAAEADARSSVPWLASRVTHAPGTSP